MRRSFIVLLGIGVIVLLVLIGLINSFNKKGLGHDTVSTSVAIPTSSPSTNFFGAGKSTTQLVNDTALLSSKDRSTLKTIQLNLPVEDADIGIAYSPITEQFIVQKKTQKADELFLNFLKNNNIEDLYEKQPSYFVITSKDLYDTLSNLEAPVIDGMITDDEDDELEEPEPTLIPNENDPSSQIQPLKNIFNTLMGFGLTPISSSQNVGTTQRSEPSSNQQSSTSPVANEVPRVQSSKNLDLAVKNSCYNFRIKKCGGTPGTNEYINENRPGTGFGTYPVDQAVLNELFSNPNAVGLYNNKKEFERGLIHPLLVKFLNEFTKSNTLDKHVGISGYGDGRCCARNGKSKTPAPGCSLTPHRLGVAIDLVTVNGSRIRDNNPNDINYRKALDWINAQRGSLRPDNATFSDAFTGMYPTDLFHPDSGHRDHLHIDYRRSLKCQ